MRFLCLLLAFVTFKCSSYELYMGGKLKWKNADIKWAIASDAPPILRESLQYASLAWSSASDGCVRLTEGEGGVRVYWDTTGAKVSAPFLGITSFAADQEGYIIPSTVVVTVNASSYSWHRGEPRGVTGWIADLDGLLLHEFGHVLGLGHSEVGGATMYWAFYPGAETLSDDDVAGVKALYTEKLPDAELSPLVLSVKRTKYGRNGIFSTLDGNPLTKWDFGDGTSAVGEKIKHRFPSRGLYLVTAKSFGRTASIWVQVGRRRK